jgi:membrane carboxypeptidase/penicillin-binding protein
MAYRMRRTSTRKRSNLYLNQIYFGNGNYGIQTRPKLLRQEC